MFKIVNPKELSGYFVGNDGTYVFDGPQKDTRRKVRAAFDMSDFLELAYDPFLIDGLNVLDQQIISSDVMRVCELEESSDIEIQPVVVEIDSIRLVKGYFIVHPKVEIEAGILDRTQADWVPDARYTIREGVAAPAYFTQDRELGFPLVSPAFVERARKARLNIEFFRYPVGTV